MLDNAFGHYWLKGALNCTTQQARALTYMVAGWLMIAGLLQVFINFDSVRTKLLAKLSGEKFQSEAMWPCPRSIKVACMYAYFICDWYWVILMYMDRDVIGFQQIVGSAVDIAIRLAFALKPSRMFKRDVPAPGPVPKVLSLSDLRKLDALAVEDTPSASELELRTRAAEAAASAAAFNLNLKLNGEDGGGATDSAKKEQ